LRDNLLAIPRLQNLGWSEHSAEIWEFAKGFDAEPLILEKDQILIQKQARNEGPIYVLLSGELDGRDIKQEQRDQVKEDRKAKKEAEAAAKKGRKAAPKPGSERSAGQKASDFLAGKSALEAKAARLRTPPKATYRVGDMIWHGPLGEDQAYQWDLVVATKYASVRMLRRDSFRAMPRDVQQPILYGPSEDQEEFLQKVHFNCI